MPGAADKTARLSCPLCAQTGDQDWFAVYLLQPDAGAGLVQRMAGFRPGHVLHNIAFSRCRICAAPRAWIAGEPPQGAFPPPLESQDCPDCGTPLPATPRPVILERGEARDFGKPSAESEEKWATPGAGGLPDSARLAMLEQVRRLRSGSVFSKPFGGRVRGEPLPGLSGLVCASARCGGTAFVRVRD